MPTLLAVSVCVFLIVRLIPGDPARLLAGDLATEQFVEELRARWRLDDPLPVQCAAYLGGLLRGDQPAGRRPADVLDPHTPA